MGLSLETETPLSLQSISKINLRKETRRFLGSSLSIARKINGAVVVVVVVAVMMMMERRGRELSTACGETAFGV